MWFVKSTTGLSLTAWVLLEQICFRCNRFREMENANQPTSEYIEEHIKWVEEKMITTSYGNYKIDEYKTQFLLNDEVGRWHTGTL